MAEQKQLTVIDSVRNMEPEFKKALPTHIDSARFSRIAQTAVNSNPSLLDNNVDKRALFAAVMAAAQDGLVLDNREAALVIFNGKPQYMPMIGGVLKKMRNSGEIANVSTGVVYQKEFDQGRFDYVKGDNESLKHHPILFGDKGAMIGVYAVVTLRDESKVRAFMDMAQIEKVRSVSRSQNGPWKTWFEEMALKSVLKKVSKLCPQNTDLDETFRKDASFISGEDEIDPPAPTPAPTAAPIKKKAAEKVKEAVIDAEYTEQEEPPVYDIRDEELPL